LVRQRHHLSGSFCKPFKHSRFPSFPFDIDGVLLHHYSAPAPRIARRITMDIGPTPRTH
jgi:hypothetical protein